ncbi:CACTA transposable element [Tanacetum coccineum]
MLPKFAQIVNRLYAFIYETKHSKSGLGLPSIVALVMTIDKSWTTISNRNSDAFLDGLFAFIKHCEPLLHPITRKIRCPCSRCCNRDDNFVTLETLEVHISSHGFDQHYTTWKYHGEPILPLPPPVPHSPEHIDMDAFFEDISANNVPTPPTQTTGPQPAQTTGPNNEFEELLSRSTQKLYPGCDMTTLEFTTEISHIKALHKITDAGFNKILALLQKACSPSKGYNFPSSYYEIKKTYKKIGLGYESIHACINDCFLFWGSEDNLKMPNCPICKASRWKDPKKTKGKKVANKVVRYFPLTPRLQRMFNTKHIAKWMTWHATGQSKENGKMNHPCDGKAWKYFDMIKPEFSCDPRNVRLGLAADGFNPFGMMSQNYSMWPVILTTYNTPPWMCMKETSLMLTMLIPGPKSPAKDIDVYLQPLIKELQELWKGVWTKDAATGTYFEMKAALLWTINDFPARSSLSGWSGQGYYACPTCNEDTPSMAVKNKIAYVGHRRFLKTNHPLRNKKKEFYGLKEPKPKPRKFSELDIQLQINKLDMKAMKDNIKAGLIPFKTDQEILDEIVLSDNRSEICRHQAGIVMSSATSAVTYTSVYTDSEPSRAFWGADDEEISEGGLPRVIVLGYDGLPIQPVAPPSPDYIPGLEDPQTPPVPQDEDEREPMFVQAHDPDYVPEPIYPEYIPLEDEREFPAKEQPLPLVNSPTTESLGYVIESDPEEDPEEYENDETEDEAEVERLLARTTSSPSPYISLSPPSAGECLVRWDVPHQPHLIPTTPTFTTVLPSPPLPLLPPSLYIPPPVDRKDDIPESEQPPRKRLCLSTLGSKYEIRESSTARPTKGRGIDYGFVSTVDAEERRQWIRDVRYGIKDTWVDSAEVVPEIEPMTVGEVNTRVTELTELHEHDTQDLYALLEDAQDSRSSSINPSVISGIAHENPSPGTPDTATAAGYSHSDTASDMRDIRREMSDMQAELLALREQQRRAKQPRLEARIPDHQDTSEDAGSHI